MGGKNSGRPRSRRSYVKVSFNLDKETFKVAKKRCEETGETLSTIFFKAMENELKVQLPDEYNRDFRNDYAQDLKERISKHIAPVLATAAIIATCKEVNIYHENLTKIDLTRPFMVILCSKVKVFYMGKPSDLEKCVDELLGIIGH